NQLTCGGRPARAGLGLASDHSNCPKLIPRKRWRRTRIAKIATGRTRMLAAALRPPQFTPKVVMKILVSATGAVTASLRVKTNASKNSFIDWIMLKTRAVAIPGTTRGRATLKKTFQGP